MAGEEIGIAWAETCEFDLAVGQWKRYFVAVEAPNDNAEIEATVTFTAATDLPVLVWWYIAVPGVDHNEIGPRPGEELTLNADRRASHRWASVETERRIEYCLQWSWVGPE